MKHILILSLAFLVAAGCSSSPVASDGATFPRTGVGVVIDRFQLVGLPVGPSRVISEADIGSFAETPDEAIAFGIPLCTDCSGRVLAFASVSAMERAMAHLQQTPSLGDGASSWLFPYGQVLVQLDGRVPREWAVQYQDALQSLARSTD